MFIVGWAIGFKAGELKEGKGQDLILPFCLPSLGECKLPNAVAERGEGARGGV
jgi:hypothetical protein